MAQIGTGTTLTFQSGLFAEILELEWSGIERPFFDSSHFGSTARTWEPGSLVEPGELAVKIAFDPEVDYYAALAAAKETVTVTFADPAPASTLAASGGLRDFAFSVPLEDRITADAVIKLSGALTHG